MSMFILQELSKLGLAITDKTILDMEALTIRFEIRGSHAMALNSQLLGVHPITFTDGDRAAFFALFGTSEAAVAEAITRIPTINQEFKVASDPFNLLAVWVIHLAHHLIKHDKVRHAFQLNVAKYLHYRFFTSLVNYFFRHGADERIMTATVNGMTRKFDIVVYGTWRKVIEARCEDLLAKGSVHHRALVDGTPDAGPRSVLYAITDTQTRIRDRVKNVVSEYYEVREKGDAVVSRPAVTEMDGEKILTQTTSAYDTVISALCAEALNINQFVDRDEASKIARQFPAISATMLIATLTQLSQTASLQAMSRELDKTERRDGKTIHVGVRALITAIVQGSFRYCQKSGVDLTNKAAVYIRLKNVYSSSRIGDPNITTIKDSVVHFVDTSGRTARESTRSSLRLAIIMYIVLRALRLL